MPIYRFINNMNKGKAVGMKGLASWAVRASFPVLAFFCLGPPLNDVASVGLWLLVLFASVFGSLARKQRWILGWCVMVFLVGVPQFFPKLSIQEGHNLFLAVDPDSVGDRMKEVYRNSAIHQLPEPIKEEMVAEFFSAYPSSTGEGDQRQWLWHEFPIELYAYSEDGWWQDPEMSRIVDSIDFDSLSSLRPGFLSDERWDYYNWMSDVQRERMPFFVEYRWPDGIGGSTLTFQGIGFQEMDGGRFSRIDAINESESINLSRNDEGKRFILFRIHPAHPVAAELEKPTIFYYAKWIGLGLQVVGIIGSVLLSFRFTFARIGVPLTLIFSGLLAANLRLSGESGPALGVFLLGTLVALLPWLKFTPRSLRVVGLLALALLACLTLPKDLGELTVLQGGMDGLRHEGFGYEVSKQLSQGDLSAALMGAEPVYYFMPGLRYFQAVEDVLFGSTKMLDYWLVTLLPFTWFLLGKRFLPSKFPWVVAGGFIASSGHFSLLWNLKQSWMDYAEPIGAFFFLIALIFWARMLHIAAGNSKERFRLSVVAYFFVSLAVFCRPNFVIAAMILGLVGLFTTWRRENLWRAILPGIGFFPVFAMLAHNLYYGGEWVLFADQATHGYTLFAPPGLYGSALVEWWSGTEGNSFERVLDHLRQWLFVMESPGMLRVGGGERPLLSGLPELHGFFVAIIPLLRIAAVGGLLFGSVFCRRLGVIGYLALVGVGLQSVLLFYGNQGRFALFAWEIGFFVLFALAVLGYQQAGWFLKRRQGGNGWKRLYRVLPWGLFSSVFMLLLIPNPVPPLALRVELDSVDAKAPKIYWSESASGFSEDQSTRAENVGGRPNSYKAKLPVDGIRFVRLDPGELPGEYKVSAINVSGVGVGSLNVPPEMLSVAGSVARFETTADGLWIQSDGVDPQLIWELDSVEVPVFWRVLGVLWPWPLFILCFLVVALLDGSLRRPRHRSHSDSSS